jgi:ribonuclease HI
MPFSSVSSQSTRSPKKIAKYEGLLAGLTAVSALGIKRLIVMGDSQLVVNFSNKSYTPKDVHMAVYP